MKKWTKVMLVTILLVLIISCIAFSFYKKSLNVDNDQVINTENKEEKDTNQNEEQQEQIETPVVSEDEKPQVVQPVETSKEENKAEEKKPTTSTNNNKTNSSNQSNTKKDPVVTETPKNEEPTTPPVVKKEIWDELGITKDEYYHSPMIKDQKVTHKTRALCEARGYEIMETEDIQFGCTEVVSYSGDTIGYMLTIR